MKNKKEKLNDKWSRKEIKNYNEQHDKIFDFIESIGFEFKRSSVEKKNFLKNDLNGYVKKFFWTVEFYTKS